MLGTNFPPTRTFLPATVFWPLHCSVHCMPAQTSPLTSPGTAPSSATDLFHNSKQVTNPAFLPLSCNTDCTFCSSWSDMKLWWPNWDEELSQYNSSLALPYMWEKTFHWQRWYLTFVKSWLLNPFTGKLSTGRITLTWLAWEYETPKLPAQWHFGQVCHRKL